MKVRRWSRVTLLGVASAMLLAACGGGSSPPASPTPTASTAQDANEQLVAAAMRNAIARGSVHVESHIRRGSQAQSFQEDVAVDRGRQRIHFGAIHAEVIQIGDQAFISGNDAAMTRYFGLPKRGLRRLAGRWASLTPRDSGYKNVTAQVTIESNITGLVPSGSLTRADSTIDGQPVVVISGSPSEDEHAPAGSKVSLYISVGAKPLPLRETLSAPDGTTGTITLSHWGEQVTLSAPKQVVPLSTLLR